MNINYCDFTEIANGIDYSQKTIVRDFNAPHTRYSATTFIGYSGSVKPNYYGNGVGVTFGEPTQIDAGMFDTGLEKFLPPTPEPKYEPKDTSGVPPLDPEVMETLCQLCNDTKTKVVSDYQVAVCVGTGAYGIHESYKTVPCSCQLIYGNLIGERVNTPAWFTKGFFANQYHYWTGTTDHTNYDNDIAKMVKNLNQLTIDTNYSGIGIKGRGSGHGIYGVSPSCKEYIGADGMGPCVGICIYSELEGLRASFHLAQGEDAWATLRQYNWPPDSRAIIAGAHGSNSTTKQQLSDILWYMWWNNITVDGFISSKDIKGIYVDRDGKWLVVPSSEYLKSIKGPDMIIPEISE
jgi:hypothetical protein